MTSSPHDHVLPRRARLAVCLLFGLYGVILGTWTTRIPAIKQDLSLTDGALSLGLLAFAAGAIIGMQAAGRLVDRYGTYRLLLPVALADGLLLVSPALAPNLIVLAGCLLAFGITHGLLNITMNTAAVEVQRAWQAPIMSSFHAVYSVGGFLGAAVGGLCAYAGLSAAATFLTVAAVVAVIAPVAARWRLAPSAVPVAETGAGRGGLPGVTFLGVLVFCCLVGEGAAADWSSVYLHDSLGSTPGFAAAAYAAFSIMMMAGRMVGDRLTATLGPVRLVRYSGVLAALGLGTALLIGHPVAGVAGFGLLGAGLACIAPQVFSTAGGQDPARAGQAIARVASLGFLGFVVGPLAIGALAELIGLPAALTIPAVLALFVAAAATSLRPRAPHPATAAPVTT
ncbi:MFS transporter [Catellatospora methionotrophica]|uniref:MFS transporter n=1 Tax=Catellatospora methionotrophica TaxID=121620 RepID=A0A8J3L7E5_9ACTN|nr:MFS transporter [Catellatospora methionotrophica]GIG15773.1 MFS transporter [Catellatospora methionotrophica]